MAVEITELAQGDGEAKITLAQRTYLDADGIAVAEDNDTRATLLGLEGDEITVSAAEAAQIPTGTLGESESSAPATKKRAPAKNKKRAPAQNK